MSKTITALQRPSEDAPLDEWMKFRQREEIVRICEDEGISMKGMAEALGINYNSFKTVFSTTDNNKIFRFPSFGLAAKLAKEYGFDVHYILTGDRVIRTLETEEIEHSRLKDKYEELHKKYESVQKKVDTLEKIIIQKTKGK